MNKQKFDNKLLDVHNQSKKILDIGCSEKSINTEFYSEFSIGIDNNFNRIKNNKSYKYLVLCDVYNLPFKNNVKFDFVIIKYVLEHLPEYKKIINIISEFTDFNGFVYVAVPKFYAFQDMLYRILGRTCEILNLGKQAHIQKFTFYKVIDLFYKNKFNLYSYKMEDAGLSFLDKNGIRKFFKYIIIGFIKLIYKIFDFNLLANNEMYFLFNKQEK